MSVSLDTFFLLLVLISGVAALILKDLLAAVIGFGAFSFFSAMFFASLGALDVAFTEAAVGAAVTTVLFVAVIFHTGPRSPEAEPRGASLAVLCAFVLAAACLLRAVPSLPAVEDPDSPAARHVSPRYIEEGLVETGAANLVTAVLVDYRSYDTLGETVVIFTAGLGCLLVLAGPGGGPRAARATRPFGSPVLDAAARLLTPCLLLFAAYVIAHGHYGPGGGFQGGVLLAAALILVRLVRGREASWGLGLSASLVLASAGLLLYAAVGFLPLAFGGNYLDYGAVPLALEPVQVRAAAGLVVEVGVGIGVMGVMVLIFEALTSGEAVE